MKPHLVIPILVLFIDSSLSKQNVDPRSLLPKLYDIEPFSTCSQTQNKYCKLEITLEPKDASVRKYIESTKTNVLAFDRSFIQRIMCLPKQTLSDKKLEVNISGLDLNHFASNISKISCLEVFSTSKWDYITLVMILLVILLHIIGTYYELSKKGSNETNEYLMAFSVISNWKKLTAPKQNEDFIKLKCIQGFRVYLMCLVIFAHTFLAWFQGSLGPYEFIETVMNNTIFRVMTAGVFFLIQINFIIANWLLANQVNVIYERNGLVAFKDVLILIVNRYFRLIPTLAFTLIFIKSSNALNFITGPQNFHIGSIFKKTCEDNWLPVLLMTNNIYPFFKMCHPVTWYLAIDTQVYVVNLLILYIKFKFKWDTKKTLLLFLGLSCLIYGLIIYFTNLNIQFLTGPKFYRYENLFYDMEFYRQYLSFYSNWSSSIIGIMLGTIYFKYKNTTLDSPIFRYSWPLALIVLTVVPFRLAIIDARSTVAAAVLGALVKPAFCIGFGFGLFGMIFSQKNLLKTICEWEFAVTMSNFVFSVYLSHFVVSFTKLFNTDSMVDILHLVGAIYFDIVVSYILAVVIATIVEQPGFNIQKLLIPQIKYAPKKEIHGNTKKMKCT